MCLFIILYPKVILVHFNSILLTSLNYPDNIPILFKNCWRAYREVKDTKPSVSTLTGQSEKKQAEENEKLADHDWTSGPLVATWLLATQVLQPPYSDKEKPSS